MYYRWNGDAAHDMVPAYSTSIEGVGGLVLSPDESKVLLIWEYGNWKPITGAVDDGESALTACRREMREECGVQMDEAFAPVFVGVFMSSVMTLEGFQPPAPNPASQILAAIILAFPWPDASPPGKAGWPIFVPSCSKTGGLPSR